MCEHTRLENVYGTVFCTDCGLANGEIPYGDEGTCKHPHLIEKDMGCHTVQIVGYSKNTSW